MDKKNTISKEASTAMITNNFSTIYSLSTGGTQNQGPFETNTTALNLYNILPYGIDAKLLVRNKSKNGNFTDNLQVDGGDIIEFKLSITNTSTTLTLSDIRSEVNITNGLLNNIGLIPIASIGTFSYTASKFTYVIFDLQPGSTAIATVELVAKFSGTVNFISQLYVVLNKYSSEARKFNLNTPSLSIVNAPDNPLINSTEIGISKAQKLMEPDMPNEQTQYCINVKNGNVIEYDLFIGNITVSPKIPVYNLKIVDNLSYNLSYISGSFKGSYRYISLEGTNASSDKILGNASFNSTNATDINGKLVGGSIEWAIYGLAPVNGTIRNMATSAILQFQCEVVG